MLPIPPSVLFSVRENPHRECYFGNTAPWPFVATGGPPPGPPAKRQRFLKNSREQTIKRLQDLRAKRSDQEEASLSKQSNCPPPLSEAELIAIFETDDLKTIRNRRKKKRRKNRKRKQLEEKRNQQQTLQEKEEPEESLTHPEAPAVVASLVAESSPTTQEPKEQEVLAEPEEDDNTTSSPDKNKEAPPPPTDTPIDSPPEPENLPETTTSDESSDDPENRDLPSLKESSPEPENHASSSDILQGLKTSPLEPTRKKPSPQPRPLTSGQTDDSWQTVRVRKKCKKNKGEKRRDYYPRHHYNNHYQQTARPYQNKRRMHILERKRPPTRRKKCLVKPRFHLPTIQPYQSPEQETKQKILSHSRIASADESSSSESLSNCSSDTSESSSACLPSKQIKRVCSCWKDFYIYSNDEKWLAVELLGSTLAHTHNCKYYAQTKNMNLELATNDISISQPPQPSVSKVSRNEEVCETFSDVQPTEMVLLESKNSKSEKATVTTPPQHRIFRPRYDFPVQQPNSDWFEHHNPDMDPEVINFNKRYSGLNLDFPARQQYPFIFTPVYRY